MANSELKRFRALFWVVPAAVVALSFVFWVAGWLRSTTEISNFIATYPGHTELPKWAPVGFPAWLGWQHFFNVFFMALVIQSGLKFRTTKKPQGYWTPRRSRPGQPPLKISLELWFHVSVDVLWLANGLLFVVLLFSTGQWVRIIPTSWEVFPNAVSAIIQYASLDWPTENGWVNYNSLQQLFYTLTVFVAAPVAAVTGLRMSLFWPNQSKALSSRFPIGVARALHFPTMLYFVIFIVVHVTLVFATGALRNLNHMYAGNDGAGWAGAIIFAVSMIVIIAASFAAKPVVLRPIASVFGKVSR